MSSRGRSTSPKPLTPSPQRAAAAAARPGADVRMDDASRSRSRSRSNSVHSRASGATAYKVVVVQGLSTNVMPAHLREIFGAYGRVVGLDLPVFKVCEWAVQRWLLLMFARLLNSSVLERVLT